MWEYQFAALLQEGFRCVAYDRRGHGRSDEPGSGYDLSTLAADLSALLEHLDLRDVTLVGHSMGCSEIVAYLAEHGSARVSRAVLAGAMTPRLVATPDDPAGVPQVYLESGRASYRLESEVVRNAAARRSTQVKAVWTFGSDTASDDGEDLPLWSIGFRPAVDATNDAKRTSTTRVRFTVSSQPGVKVGVLAKPVVEISGDQGETWQPTTVVAQRGGYVAVGATPPGATISLRAMASDSAGNAVEQTVLNAYGLR